MSVEMPFRVIIESKDEYYPDGRTENGQPGKLPPPARAAEHMADMLADHTRRDTELGWRVTSVRPDDGPAGDRQVRYRVIRVSNRTGKEQETAWYVVRPGQDSKVRAEAIAFASTSENASHVVGAHFRVERVTTDLVWSGGASA